MIPALIIVFREGFEAFLTVAIIFAFLRKTGRDWLRPAVYAGIVTSIAASFAPRLRVDARSASISR